MKRKTYMFISIALLITIFLSFLIVNAYAEDIDLSNLNQTTSATVRIDSSLYTINNSNDIDGLLELKDAIDNYRQEKSLNSYEKIYEQTIAFLTDYAANISTSNINNVIYYYNGVFYMNKEHTNILYKDGNTQYSNMAEIINTAKEDLVISLLTQYTVKVNESWEPSVDIILFRGDSDGKRFIELNQNITLTMKPKDGGNLTIDGYSQKIKTTYTPIRASKGSTINIYDHVVIKEFWCTTNGGAMYLDGGTINIYGGIFYHNVAGATGGFVTLTNGDFNVYDGIFANNSAAGGGVFTLRYVSNNGIVNFTGGVFVNNSSSKDGGAIHMTSGTLNMENVVIYGNSTIDNGGFLYISSGNFNLSNSLIYDNIATNHAGAIYMTGGNLKMDSGYIGIDADDSNTKRANIANNGSGGGIYITGGSITIDGGNISSNSTISKNGGGLFVNGGTFTINAGNIYNNTSFLDGGGVYVNGGNFKMNGGSIYSNEAPNGGGVYVSAGDTTITGGNIGLSEKGNKASVGNGGGIYVAGGNVNISGGNVSYNQTLTGNGGGLYLNGGTFKMSNGIINHNNSINGAGAYIIDATFELTGGIFEKNSATLNGGGFFIGDNSNVSLSNGEVRNNQAKNGSGFYQTQEKNESKTELKGNCIVTNNEARNGNGAGVYIDGGSTFRMTGGKVTYNKATVSSTLNLLSAKDSTSGVGGGVYISKGTFTMYDEFDKPGTAAIFGNTADYAADDLFASGENTSFDAISVINMEKADAYKTADSWFEDFPLGESHITLNYEKRNDGNIVNDTLESLGRYKDMTNSEDKHIATTVLHRNCNDYIAITMGNSVGKIRLSVLGDNVIQTHTFIYQIESCATEACNDETPEIVINTLVQKNKDINVVDIPTGIYKITIVPSWSWRFNQNVNYKIIENDTEKEVITAKSVKVNVYSEQYTNINTTYTYLDKHWLTETSIIKG